MGEVPSSEFRVPSAERAHVRVEPGVRVGKPCIGGTRIDTECVANVVWQGLDPVGPDWYASSLTREEVLVACWYEARYGPKRWRRAWREWRLRYESNRALTAYPPSKAEAS